MRRLPVYILLDTSGSMKGEPIHSVNVGLQSMLSALRQDPYALESVYISIITFDIEARVYLSLTPLEEIQIPEIEVPSSGATFMGAALEGDWRPLIFLMTDGAPSDVYAYQQIIPHIQQLNFATIVACAAGPKAKTETLLQLTQKVVVLDTMDTTSFSSFFKWVSASVVAGSSSAGISGPISLPPPPSEIQLVL